MSKSYRYDQDQFESRRKSAVKQAKRTLSDPDRRADQRARRWLSTGVSESTVAWMRDSDLL